jgi:hypothetical protein
MIYLDERAVMKDEFANMLISWDIDEASAEKAYDYMTEHGKKRMDCMCPKEFLFYFFSIYLF